MSDKPKRQLTSEQLERLAAARAKALQVRQEKAQKMREIKALESEASKKAIDDRISSLKQQVERPVAQVEAQTSVEVPPAIAKEKPRRMHKAEVVRKVLEEESSESSGDESDSDDDDDVTEPIKTVYKNKYREKYKNKYQAKAVSTLTKGYAAQTIKKRVDDELARMAAYNLFGA